MKVEMRKVATLVPYERNAKMHNETQIKNVAESIRRFGFVQPIVIDRDGVIVIGHCRTEAAKQLGMDEVPCVCVDDLTEEQVKALRIVDNKTNESPWDTDLLKDELEGLDLEGFEFDWELDDEEDNVVEQREENARLADKFTVAPMSALDARGGEWVKRKRIWRRMIGDDGSARPTGNFKTRDKFREKVGDKVVKSYAGSGSGSSVLDPVLAEVICQWFSPMAEYGNSVFDTFAGDTVFGYVAAYKGMNFTGIELREEQVAFNQSVMDKAGLAGRYICDDGRNVAEYLEPSSQDLYFSCPPYFDLEVYSDKENDASNQPTYEEFYAVLDVAFTEAAKLLKDNRFAVVVAQDVRNKKTGGYFGFTDDIKATFKRNGFTLCNEIVLLRPIGSAALFASTNMTGRKVTRVHEDILVFFKGDQREISKIYGDVEMPTDLSEWEDDGSED